MVRLAKRAVGVDIGSRRIKVVVLKKGKRGIEVENVRLEPIPLGCIVDHQIMDAFQVSEALATATKSVKARGKEITAALYGKQVIIKKITTDLMSQDELAAAITYEAEQSLPFDVKEVTLDYTALPRELDAEGMEVLLVAAKNDLVRSVVDTVREAGCKPAIFELEPFALQAMLVENGDLDEKSTLAVLQIGFQASTVTLFQAGRFEGTRDIGIAGKTYVETLIRHRGISFERAMAILAKSELSSSDERSLEETARWVGEKLADAVVRSFPSNFGPAAESSVTRVLVCGGGAHLPGVVGVLTERLATEVEVADPLRFAIASTDGQENKWQDVAPDLTMAVGLALRGLGDLHPGFNLLPPEERKGAKRGYLSGANVVLPILISAFLLLVMVITTIVQESKLGILKGQLKEVQQEGSMYADKIAVVEELTAKRNDIAARINLIEQLDHDRFSHIHLLDEINRALPSLTWLTSLKEKGDGGIASVEMEGVTSSNLKVAEFMSNLVASSYFSDVNLTITEKGDIAHTGVTKFTLQAAIKSDSTNRIATLPKNEDAIAKGANAVKQMRASTHPRAGKP